MTVCWQRQKHWSDTVFLCYDTISEGRYQQLYERTDKSFWNFSILQLYRSNSSVRGDGWEPPWITCGDVSWLPGGADISFLNYTQHRIQLNFTTHKDNIFWTNGSYFSASSPNTRKHLLAHPYPYKISYSPQPLPDTCDITKLQCHNLKEHNTGWCKNTTSLQTRRRVSSSFF